MKVSDSKQLISRSAAVFFAVVSVVLSIPARAQVPPPGPAPAVPPPLVAGRNPEDFVARYVKAENFQAYVAKISATMSMSHREIDPFGRNQDPNFRPPQPQIARPDTADQGSEVIAPVPLSELIAGIQVTMVMPTKQTFFVGDRAFHRGDRFPLRTGAGTLINVEILSVTSSAITFRNITKGETAVLRLGGSPAGIQRGTTLETPAGVTVPNPAAPLDLQPAPVPTTPPR